MSGYRKLGRRTSAQRDSMLRSLATGLIYNGRIITTEARAKEARRIAEKLITLAVKERDNFETITVSAKVPRKNAEGRRVKEVVDGKKKTVFDAIEKTIKKDSPSRLNARRKILSVLHPVTETPKDGRKKRSLTKKADLAAKLFDEIAPKYQNRPGGYTRIIKIGPRKGDAALQVVLELV